MAKYRKPVRVDVALSAQLNTTMALWDIEVPGEYTLYVTKTRCGRHSSTQMNITVPVWAIKQAAKDECIHGFDPEYAVYYACHEIAHILSTESRVRGVMHSPEFYDAFKRVCPPHLWHFEIGYKPQLAAAAGIRSKK